jgi:hypothetical protein
MPLFIEPGDEVVVIEDEIVELVCGSCRTANDEDADYCKACGACFVDDDDEGDDDLDDQDEEDGDDDED